MVTCSLVQLKANTILNYLKPFLPGLLKSSVKYILVYKSLMHSPHCNVCKLLAFRRKTRGRKNRGPNRLCLWEAAHRAAGSWQRHFKLLPTSDRRGGQNKGKIFGSLASVTSIPADLTLSWLSVLSKTCVSRFLWTTSSLKGLAGAKSAAKVGTSCYGQGLLLVVQSIHSGTTGLGGQSLVTPRLD